MEINLFTRAHAIALCTTFVAGLLLAPTAFAAAIDDDDVFEMDENAEDATPTPIGDDWETLYDDCGTTGNGDCGNAFAVNVRIVHLFSMNRHHHELTGGYGLGGVRQVIVARG